MYGWTDGRTDGQVVEDAWAFSYLSKDIREARPRVALLCRPSSPPYPGPCTLRLRGSGRGGWVLGFWARDIWGGGMIRQEQGPRPADGSEPTLSPHRFSYRLSGADQDLVDLTPQGLAPCPALPQVGGHAGPPAAPEAHLSVSPA